MEIRYPPRFSVLLAALVINAQAATVGYWRFENESGFFKDSSGNGFNLTNSGRGGAQSMIPFSGAGCEFPTTVPLTLAANEKLLTYNAVGNGMTVADHSAFTNPTFTLELYFNYGALGSFGSAVNMNILMGQFSAYGGGRSFAFSINGINQLELVLSKNGAVAERILSGFTLRPNTDYYAAVTVNLADTSTSGITFYIQSLAEGGFLSAGTGVAHTTTSIFNSDAFFTIGAQGQGGNDVIGLFDEVRFSNTQLARAELLAYPTPEPAPAPR
jgi:Concanavalin A-like lectin/glucanases superfamily